MTASQSTKFDPAMDLPSRILWRLGWDPRPLYMICVAMGLLASWELHTLAGMLVAIAAPVLHWKATALVNEDSKRILELAESVVTSAGAKRVGVDSDSSRCRVILIGHGDTPLGVKFSPNYSVTALYVGDAFFAIYSGTAFALSDLELRLATTGDEVYFRHVSAINYHDSAIEILLSQGKKAKHIAVGSDADAAVVLELLRPSLRTPQEAAQPVKVIETASPTVAGDAVNVEGERRCCYLRFSKLMEYYSDPVVINSLLEQLWVPGTTASLNRMTESEKREAIEHHIEHLRATPNSYWYGVPTHEILAAAIWLTRGEHLTERLVRDKFYAVSREEDLMRPVAQWLMVRGEEPYQEVPMGRRRIDVLGYRRPVTNGTTRLTAVELKNDDEQFRRGPDQMGTFAEYAHAVYLACTPAFAAEYLQKNADNRNVNHWDPGLLDRKLKQGGFGLLIVEREKVFETIKPVERDPNATAVSRVVAGLSNFQRIELD